MFFWRLTYENARARTKTMLFRGMGLGLPFYGLCRLWKSYKANWDGETLDWEYHSSITLKDESIWRIFAYIGAHAALIGMLVLTVVMAQRPKNGGDITVAEFCENYNRLAKYYGFDTGSYLNTAGNWVQDEIDGYVIHIGRYDDNPTFQFSETDGVMTGMWFSVESHGSDQLLLSYQNEMSLSILAFVGAQDNSAAQKYCKKPSRISI